MLEEFEVLKSKFCTFLVFVRLMMLFYFYYRFGIDNKTHAAIGKVEKASLEVLEKRGKRFGLCSEEAEVSLSFVILYLFYQRNL